VTSQNRCGWDGFLSSSALARIIFQAELRACGCLTTTNRRKPCGRPEFGPCSSCGLFTSAYVGCLPKKTVTHELLIFRSAPYCCVEKKSRTMNSVFVPISVCGSLIIVDRVRSSGCLSSPVPRSFDINNVGPHRSRDKKCFT